MNVKNQFAGFKKISFSTFIVIKLQLYINVGSIIFLKICISIENVAFHLFQASFCFEQFSFCRFSSYVLHI